MAKHFGMRFFIGDQGMFPAQAAPYNHLVYSSYDRNDGITLTERDTSTPSSNHFQQQRRAQYGPEHRNSVGRSYFQSMVAGCQKVSPGCDHCYASSGCRWLIRSLNQLPDGHPSVEKTADLLIEAVLVHAPFLIQPELLGGRLG
jgi:hypothetical protein